jgi:hypothetical protein
LGGALGAHRDQLVDLRLGPGVLGDQDRAQRLEARPRDRVEVGVGERGVDVADPLDQILAQVLEPAELERLELE